MDLATAAATMLITIFGADSNAVTSAPVATMQECRKNMVAYIDEMPDVSVMRKSENMIVGQGKPVYNTVRIIVKCQSRNNPNS